MISKVAPIGILQAISHSDVCLVSSDVSCNKQRERFLCSKGALLELPGQKCILHAVIVIAGGCVICHCYAFV